MKKKVLLQVMGAVLVAGLMAGCGGTNDTKTEETTAYTITCLFSS